MKNKLIVLFAASLALAAFSLHAETAEDGKFGAFVAKQGDATIYAIDVDAHVAPMPIKNRSGFINNPKRIEQMLSHMLLRRNLALEAKASGLDQDPIVQREIELAAEGILMRRRLDQLLEEMTIPDLLPLAQERYLAEPSKFQVSDQAAVTHILLKPNEQRDESQVRAQLQAWRADILAGKSKLEDLAAEYSDEPAAKSSRGVLKMMPLSRYVPEFADAARKLRNPGDLSEPVKTEFGWHLIQLNAFEPGRKLSFDEVRGDLVAAERQKYIASEQEKYVARLKELPIEASEESIAPLRERYGKLDYDAVESQPKAEASEQDAPKQ